MQFRGLLSGRFLSVVEIRFLHTDQRSSFAIDRGLSLMLFFVAVTAACRPVHSCRPWRFAFARYRIGAPA